MQIFEANTRAADLLTCQMKYTKLILTHLAMGHPCVLFPSLPVYITFSILIARPVKPDLQSKMCNESKHKESSMQWLCNAVHVYSNFSRSQTDG